MAASWNGHVEVVDRLVLRGARVNLQKKVKTASFSTQISLQARASQCVCQKCLLFKVLCDETYLKDGFNSGY